MNPIAVGVIVNSALYLTAVLVGGIYFHNPIAIKLDIAAIGVAYLSYLAQTFPGPRWSAELMVAVSVALGAAAGLDLL